MDDPIRHHITTVATREDDDTHILTRALMNACWPHGHADRTEPVALPWVRTMGPTHPARLHADLPVCTCTQGRCLVCN